VRGFIVRCECVFVVAGLLGSLFFGVCLCLEDVCVHVLLCGFAGCVFVFVYVCACVCCCCCLCLCCCFLFPLPGVCFSCFFFAVFCGCFVVFCFVVLWWRCLCGLWNGHWVACFCVRVFCSWPVCECVFSLCCVRGGLFGIDAVDSVCFESKLFAWQRSSSLVVCAVLFLEILVLVDVCVCAFILMWVVSCICSLRGACCVGYFCFRCVLCCDMVEVSDLLLADVCGDASVVLESLW